MYVFNAPPPPGNMRSFHEVSTPESCKEGRCNEVTNIVNIPNAQPNDTVSKIFMPETGINKPMQRHKNMKYTEAERLKSDWTEEVKLNKN